MMGTPPGAGLRADRPQGAGQRVRHHLCGHPQPLPPALARAALHQGPLQDLHRYSGSEFSDTARRLTNLFRAPSPVPAHEMRNELMMGLAERGRR